MGIISNEKSHLMELEKCNEKLQDEEEIDLRSIKKISLEKRYEFAENSPKGRFSRVSVI